MMDQTIISNNLNDKLQMCPYPIVMIKELLFIRLLIFEKIFKKKCLFL